MKPTKKKCLHRGPWIYKWYNGRGDILAKQRTCTICFAVEKLVRTKVGEKYEQVPIH